MLDGSASFDVDADTLSYSWTRLSAPPGAAGFAESNDANSTVFLDETGTYEFLLQVTDEHGASDSSVLTIRSTLHDAIIVGAGQDVSGPTGNAIDLTAFLDEKNARDVSISWTLLSKPAGSVTEVGAESSLTTQITPDVQGTYVLEFLAESAWASSRDEVRVYGTAHQNFLDEPFNTSLYSRALDRVVYRTFSSTLRVADLSTGTEDQLSLVQGFDISPDGLKVAVSYQDTIFDIDLETLQTLQTFSVRGKPMYESSEHIYTQSGRRIFIIDLVASTIRSETIDFLGFIGARLARTAPGILYSFRDSSSDDDGIKTADVYVSPPQITGDSTSVGTLAVCRGLWASTNGAFVVTRCGDVLEPSIDPLVHLSIQANLGTGILEHVHFAPATERFVVVERPLPSAAVHLFDATDYSSLGTIVVPQVLHPTSPGVYSDLQVRDAFFSADETQLLIAGNYTFDGESYGAIVRVDL